ncbi:MAG: hypothetical protein ABJA57_12400 [Ginsengibacter sp.]
MKSIKKTGSIAQRLFALLLLSFIQTAVLAQDGGGTSKVDISVNKSSDTWYTQPWVWIVGGAVFLLLLVALMRGNSNKD